jgi:acetoin utilization deacetylase AcuC-like enzyme
MLTAVHSPLTRLHDPGAEIWVGVAIPGTEVAERVDAILGSLHSAGATIVEPTPQPSEALATVHDPDMVGFLRTVWDRWQTSIYPVEAGQDRVVPYAFPLRQMTSGRPPRKPASIGAEVGMWAMDTMTLIGPGSWRAIEAAAGCALTAADLVADGGSAAYALCRPPGHHVGRDFYGGSCYLNNAALAAQRLRDRGAEVVTVVDIDAHHGNGTQEIFYTRTDIRYGSAHVDPGQGWFPHYVGYADEVGAGVGEGWNRNLPLTPGSDDATWLEAVEELTRFAAGSDALVVSLGVDAAAGDPESPLEITADGYRRAGALIGSLGTPTVAVQEGGYDLPTLGGLVTGFLEGLVSG